jgi:hypothetical protein
MLSGVDKYQKRIHGKELYLIIILDILNKRCIFASKRRRDCGTLPSWVKHN